MPRPTSSLRLVWLFLILFVCLVIFGLRSCRQRTPTMTASNDRSEPSRVSPPSSVGAGEAVVVKPLPPASGAVPVIASGQKGMLSVSFVFDSTGNLAVGSRDEVPEATVRPLRKVEGQPGLYHRIVGAGGEKLFENLVPDPRQVHWDTTDDGKTLRGGLATLPDKPLVLRLPAGVRGRLEVFLINDPGWTMLTLAERAKIVGSFDLQ